MEGRKGARLKREGGRVRNGREVIMESRREMENAGTERKIAVWEGGSDNGMVEEEQEE